MIVCLFDMVKFKMLHVWDHFDYTNDVKWWRSTGWPLLKVSHVRHQSSAPCFYSMTIREQLCST